MPQRCNVPMLVAGFLTTGCATYEQPFEKLPDESLACVAVQWTETPQIKNHCSPSAAACGTVGNGSNLNMIWTPKPRSFDDYHRVYLLGHELLHSLGATHAAK